MSKGNIIMKNKLLNFNQKDLKNRIFKLAESFIYLKKKKSFNKSKSGFYCDVCHCDLDNIDSAMKHYKGMAHEKNIDRMSLFYFAKYLPGSTVNQYDAINDCLQEKLSNEIFISDNEAVRRKALCEEMNSIAKEKGLKLSICGSLVTGLSLINFSDVNLYLDIEYKNHIKIDYLSILNQLATKLQQILKLKTLIKLGKNDSGLFCEDCKGVSYHISVSSYSYQLSSMLINVYLQIDDRAKKLIQLFRYFANKAFIDKSRNGFFPSQIFSILAIFYLQHLPIPVLPNLHRLAECNRDLPDVFVTTVINKGRVVRYVSDLSTIKSLWTPPNNTSSLAELWLGLLRFYTIEFDKTFFMVSIRSHYPLLKQYRRVLSKLLTVEDPFDYNKNLLLSWNSFDVIDFINDQFQKCYIYFGVPQLKTGPAFTYVNYYEITNDATSTTCVVKSTFKRENFTNLIDSLHIEFRKLFEDNKLYYDLSNWPAVLFSKMCLEKILIGIFESKDEVDYIIWLFKIARSTSYFSIANYDSFKKYVLELTELVFNDFAFYFDSNKALSNGVITIKSALSIVKEATKKFIKKSLNISISEENEDEECEEEAGQTMEDLDNTSENGNEKFDNGSEENDNSIFIENVSIPIKNKKSESWKIPISFKEIFITIAGYVEACNEKNTYNEQRVKTLKKNEIKYDFNKCIYYKQRLRLICMICDKGGHREEFCDELLPKFGELKGILKDVDSQCRNKLNDILLKRYEDTLPSRERLELCQKIFNDISAIIRGVYPNAQPQMFGSASNGFITRASDIDICVEFSTNKKVNHLSNIDITTTFRNIGRNLTKSLEGIRIQYILSAKIPIIKFFLPKNIQGDISINNILAIHNSRMIKLYGDLFPKMKFVGNLLKTMAKICDIGDASKGTLSSYAYMLMLIHFLQKRGFLPVLQELYEGVKKPSGDVDGYNTWYQSDTDIIAKLWQPKSTIVSVEYLWLDFFYYYLVEFDIDREVVSIKQSIPLYKIEKEWQMSCIAIEDPFRLDHNLSGSLSLENCVYILQCFAQILKQHSNNHNLINQDSLNILMKNVIPRPETRTYNNTKRDRSVTDVTEAIDKNTTAINKELPILPTSLKYQECIIPNHYFLETDSLKMTSTESTSLDKFNFDLQNLSVLPIKLPFGDESIVIPMLIGKDMEISKKFNNILQDGSDQVSHFSASKHSTANSNKMQDNLSKDFTTNESIRNTLVNIPAMPLNNQIPYQVLNNKPYRYIPQMNSNFVPNSVKLITKKQTRQNYNASHNFQFGEVRPPLEQYRNQQNYAYQYITNPGKVIIKPNNYADYVSGGYNIR